VTLSISELLIQNQYITQEQYNHCHKLQQEQALEERKPLVQLYLELGYCHIEHIEYCIKLRSYYLEQGQQENNQEDPEFFNKESSESVICSNCLSNCNPEWAICPFCGSNL